MRLLLPKKHLCEAAQLSPMAMGVRCLISTCSMPKYHHKIYHTRSCHSGEPQQEYVPFDDKPPHLRPPLRKYLNYLPKTYILPKTKEKVIFDRFQNWDKLELYEIMKEVVENGTAYCMDELSMSDFEGYFLSHDAFVVRNAATLECLGGIYLKPNFPGRSSHIGNGGYIVKKEHRYKGIGHILAKESAIAARDLGYKAMYGNLLYDTNGPSKAVAMKKMKLSITGTIPRGGNLKGYGYVDAHQMYFSLLEAEKL